MIQQIQAIYEQGVIRPLEPVELVEGEKIEIVLRINRNEQNHKALTQLLAEIAALPIEGKSNEFSGANHDEILYPKTEK